MIDIAKMTQGAQMLLDGLGTDFTDPNFSETPKRLVNAYLQMLHYEDTELLDVELDLIFKKSFPSTYDGIVIVDNIKAKSLCPHHMFPVKYIVDVGYISSIGHGALGISKLPRIVKMLAKRRVLQETYTDEIAKTLMKGLKADGVIVIVRGDHSCMTSRGVTETDATTITSSVYGIFKKDLGARQEFLSLINNHK